MLVMLMLFGVANASSWRVCSKPEAGAHFLSVADAVAANTVFSGDTLYIEPGHYESTNVTVNKTLTLIGPGHSFTDNSYNMMDASTASLKDISLNNANSTILGCTIYGTLNLHESNTRAAGCFIVRNSWQDVGVQVSGANSILQRCYIVGKVQITTTDRFGPDGNAENSIIENNIIVGYFTSSGTTGGVQIRNNVIVHDDKNSFQENYYTVTFPNGIYNSSIYNNIICRIDNRTFTVTNNQIVDTFYSKDFIFQDNYVSTNNINIHNNILSCKNNANYRNCVFNATVESELLWNDANTLEERYKHKVTGSAVGAGVNGTTCGAYGAVNGGIEYQPSGIPLHRPYIYDAEIDQTPSSNNTINASFKIKVQNQ